MMEAKYINNSEKNDVGIYSNIFMSVIVAPAVRRSRNKQVICVVGVAMVSQR